MRTMQRVLVVTAGLVIAGGPGVSIAGWNYQDNGPRFALRDEVSSKVLVLERVSLAPKDSVADMRSFQELDSHWAGLYGPSGPPKPSLDRYWATRYRGDASGHSAIATDTD